MRLHITMYDLKEKDYFSNIRRDLIEEIPFGPHIVLEVGCGQGETGAALKKKDALFGLLESSLSMMRHNALIKY